MQSPAVSFPPSANRTSIASEPAGPGSATALPASQAHPPPQIGSQGCSPSLRCFSSPEPVAPGDIAGPGEHPLAKLASALSAHTPSAPPEITAELWHLTQAALARAADVETHGLGAGPQDDAGFEALGTRLMHAGIRCMEAAALLCASEDRPIVRTLLPHSITTYGRLLAQLEIPPYAAAECLQEKDSLGRPALLQAYESKNHAEIRAVAETTRALKFPGSLALSLLDADYVVDGAPHSGLRQIAQEDSLAARTLLHILKPLREACVTSEAPHGQPAGAVHQHAAPQDDFNDVKSLYERAMIVIAEKERGSPGSVSSEDANALRETSASLRREWRHNVHTTIDSIPFCWALECLATALRATEASGADTALRLDTPLHSGQTILRLIISRGDTDSLKRYGKLLKERCVSLPDVARLLNSGSGGKPPLPLAYEHGDLDMIREIALMLRDLAFPASTALRCWMWTPARLMSHAS